MNEYTILVPCRFNDGKKVKRAQFAWLENQLLSSFGGYTDTGKVQGAWKNEEGRLFKDTNRRYAVACEDPSQVAEIARMVAHRWDQEAIYIAQTSDRVEFISVEK